MVAKLKFCFKIKRNRFEKVKRAMKMSVNLLSEFLLKLLLTQLGFYLKVFVALSNAIKIELIKDEVY